MKRISFARGLRALGQAIALQAGFERDYANWQWRSAGDQDAWLRERGWIYA